MAEVTYEDKLNLFYKRIAQLKSIVDNLEPEMGKTYIARMDIDSIINLLEPEIDNPYFSISYFYQGMINIGDVSAGEDDDIIFMVWVLTSMLYEKFLISSSSKDYGYFIELLNNGLSLKIKNVHNLEDKTFELERYQKDFISYKLSYLLNEEKIKTISKKLTEPTSLFNSMKEDLKNEKTLIDKKLSEYQNRSNEIKQFIKDQQTNLNFVGLSKAFKQLIDEKTEVKNKIEKRLLSFFIALIIVPAIVAVIIYCVNVNYYTCVPATTIELMLLYGFRLLYQQYLFVKSELLQLNLRYSLSAFIESYMEFKKNNKDNTVDLFEQLIFSNIISDEKKVPATVDGLESIAKIIESIKCK